MKKFAFLTAALFYMGCACAQEAEPERGFRKEKLFAGGNFGMAFGRFTFVNLSPQVGYRFNRFFAGGLGFNLVYASQKERDVFGNDYSKTSQWVTGLNAFARLYPSQRFMLQVQPEANYTFGNIRYYQPTETRFKLDAEIVPSLLLGGGLVMPTERGALLTTLMYDVLQKPNSPYGNRPIVNVGFNINF